MLASCGQRSRARAPRRCSTECLVDSGYLAMAHPDHSRLSDVAGVGVLPGHLGEVRHRDHMPVSSPFVIVLTEPERRELSRQARSTRTPYRDRIRARIVLAAADGGPN